MKKFAPTIIKAVPTILKHAPTIIKHAPSIIKTVTKLVEFERQVFNELINGFCGLQFFHSPGAVVVPFRCYEKADSDSQKFDKEKCSHCRLSVPFSPIAH